MSILALTSDTLIVTPASGNLEYNGQFFGTDSNASRAQMQRIVRATAQASTSGTSIDFTGIPAWVERITVMFNGVSTNGSSTIRLQLGDAGGIETTGYAGTCTQIGSTVSTAYSTSGFDSTGDTSSTQTRNGQFMFALLGSNTWSLIGAYNISSAFQYLFCGTKTLSDTLTQVRITTVNGTDTFDAGSVNIIYEG
jgi:hypothetical protein